MHTIHLHVTLCLLSKMPITCSIMTLVTHQYIELHILAYHVNVVLVVASHYLFAVYWSGIVFIQRN